MDSAQPNMGLGWPRAYLEQLEFVESVGSRAIVMASRQLAAVARSAEDYLHALLTDPEPAVHRLSLLFATAGLTR